MDYVPYTDNTKRQLERLAALKPRTLAAMHGSTFVGDGAALLTASVDIIRDVSAGRRPGQRRGIAPRSTRRAAIDAPPEPAATVAARWRTTRRSSDGDLARAVAARGPGVGARSGERAVSPFRASRPLYGLRHLRDEDAARDLVQQVMLLTDREAARPARSATPIRSARSSSASAGR